MFKHRDKDNKYTEGLLKEYNYRVLEVNYRQPTLWTYVIFCKREWVKTISELENEELIELKTVLQEIEKALSSNPLFSPIRFNYRQMWNGLHHLHIHGIPRYEIEKNFLERTWIDQDCKKPVIRSFKDESENTVIQIREEIKKYL